MKRGVRWLAAVAVVLAAAATAASQTVGRAMFDDPNEVAGLLDVRRVWFDPEAGPPLWTIVTYLEWRTQDVRDRGFVVVRIDTFGDERPDYYALIRSDGRELSASLWRDPRHGADVRVRGLRVVRTNRTNVQVSVAIGALDVGAHRSVYRWSVVSLFTGATCPGTCADAVPDEGVVEQLLPGASPTPTPTSTPTPTPTPTVTPTPTPPAPVGA